MSRSPRRAVRELPSSEDLDPHPTTTTPATPTPCFTMSRGNLRWADEQIGATADWPPRYDDDIWNLDAMIRNSQNFEWRGLDLGKHNK